MLVMHTALPNVDQAASRRPTQNWSKREEPSQLVLSLNDAFVESELIPINRRYWNESSGKLLS
jgi:hypothetical protein